MNLTNLQKLNLSINKIQEIPKEIGQLVNLQRFYCSENKIRSGHMVIPSSIFKAL